MHTRRLAVPGFAVAVALFAGSCADVPPTQPLLRAPGDVQLFTRPADPAADLRVTLDARLARVAEAVPGYAGHFVDAAGTLNIRMTAAAVDRSVGAVREALRHELAQVGVDVAARPIEVLPASHDFGQLNALHQRAAAVLGLAGVVYTDADEVSNRVAIGVENAGAAAAVAHALAMLDVPAEAVAVREVEPVRFMQTLQQRVRPVAGGLQINFPGFLCTLGFNVRSPEAPGVHGFVTNSHCTNNQWQFNPAAPTPYAQPSGVATCPTGDNCIGFEAHDAPGTVDPPCPAGRICRNSDAAGVRYAPGVENAFARIYRTTGFNSLTIDAATPFFNIVAEAPTNLAVGDSVHKVGRTTGWTRGVVTSSCATTNVGGTNFTLFCQDIVTGPVNSVAGGDSGSGAWTPSPLGQLANVRLNGILWGGSGSTIFVYSPMQRIRMDNPPPAGATWRVFPPPPAP